MKDWLPERVLAADGTTDHLPIFLSLSLMVMQFTQNRVRVPPGKVDGYRELAVWRVLLRKSER